MKNVLEFLAAVRLHNNREWFEQNKAWYLAVKEEFDAFTEGLIAGIAGFDPSVAGLTSKECTYRIYRDTRFSANKDPYKTHMGAYVCPGGKKSGLSGYYFHVEPRGDGFFGGSLLSVGMYMPEPKVLRSIREEIEDNGAEFEATIHKAAGFRICEESKLKRVPAGFAADSPMAEYLKLKDIYLEKHVDNAFIESPDLLKKTVAAFRKAKPFNDLINRAARYALEEM
ncbi:MAG: DUF2461 domain-containing protein [Rikenellaceae bacterium]|nr:DUF2461 domain-containing protein [Rikenellaceae bacterium]